MPEGARPDVALDVVGIGFCCQDELLLLSQIPPPEGRAALRARGAQGGGMVATAMVAVARLGGRAGFIGALGDDPTGDRITAEFIRYGVDVSRMQRQAGKTSHRTTVLVDERTGARSFLSDFGSVPPVDAAELDMKYVTSAKLLHLSEASEAALVAARAVRAAGGEVCFDGTHFDPQLMELAPLVDYLIVSRFFAAEFLEHSGVSGSLLEAARRMRTHGPRVVVVTEGELGSWCASDEGEIHTPAFPVSPIVDTTGAGDVFHGAFLYGRAQGWTLRRCLRLASATAALKCRMLGGRAGIPTLEESQALIDSSGTEE
jgi:sulfofructose kinase